MESLEAVLAHVESAAVTADRQTVLRAQTAVEELFANSVTHGNRDNDPQASVWLEAVEVNGDLRLRYEDAFEAFNPFEDVDTTSRLGRMDIDDRAVGGLGRLLVLQLADDADYHHDGERNCISLRFAPH